MKKANITEVAKLSGVSKTTVSNYLNNKGNKLSDDTKKKIKKVIDELNYVPGIGARKLSLKNASKTIGVVMERTAMEDSLGDTIFNFSHIFSYISTLLEKNNIKYIIIPDQNLQAEKMIDYIKGLCSSNLLDGIMLVNIQTNDIYINELKNMQFPFVCFGHTQIPGINNFVATNHENSITKAVNLLISEGVEDIYCYWTKESKVVYDQFNFGYKRAMEQNNLPIKDSYFIAKDFDSKEPIKGEFYKIFENQSKPYGFIIPAYKLNVLLEVAKKMKKKIRKDFLVILYDYHSTTVKESYYTYIETPAKQLGISAINMLLSEMDIDCKSKVTEKTFDANLIVNQSSRFK
ncbi:MAG: LacI family DNA-binding transcriptional regulator [Sphaerochaetaceae bacterium]|nr:LacI family DNA-binding transcriptional regulator [Sphaerochaetaceae bacterium]